MMRRMRSRLPNARIEPEVAHQLLRRRKATDISNRGNQADRHGGIDTVDAEQALDLLILEHCLTEIPIHNLEVLSQAIKLSQPLLDGKPLIQRQRLFLQPCSTSR